MSSATAELIQRHYEGGEDTPALMARVTDLLKPFGSGSITTTQLAGFDQFHLRGLAATKELAELARIQPGMKILDAGCGLGGPTRYLAETYGCTVVGIDLTPAFVAIAQLLTERTGLTNRASYQAGDLSALPFPDRIFDVVWTQHVVMNIPNRDQVYEEFHRVLKPGGKLAFYDILAADERPELAFPLPWAATPETSFLLNKAETLAALHRAGFATGLWNDVTAEALTFIAQPQPSPQSQSLSLAALLGQRTVTMLPNLARNLREGRLRLVMGLYEPTPKPN